MTEESKETEDLLDPELTSIAEGEDDVLEYGLLPPDLRPSELTPARPDYSLLPDLFSPTTTPVLEVRTLAFEIDALDTLSFMLIALSFGKASYKLRLPFPLLKRNTRHYPPQCATLFIS